MANTKHTLEDETVECERVMLYSLQIVSRDTCHVTCVTWSAAPAGGTTQQEACSEELHVLYKRRNEGWVLARCDVVS